ncbi:PREDICTED: cryptochrome-2-like [Acropora digitifera]|uniref:cryptochrome-2-like n=1 Tax=Acropora digitifera TaxID=70779 RepID=UPI00077B08DA|nr:PREDICTED: cryptochrome-2-like [Acropora digitifera]
MAAQFQSYTFSATTHSSQVVVSLNGFNRKYLPVLKGFPAKYIHAPWTAPENVQRAARCIIGKDYPRPIVDHHKVSTANLEKMRNVFKALLRYKESSKYIVPNNSVTVG